MAKVKVKTKASKVRRKFVLSLSEKEAVALYQSIRPGAAWDRNEIRILDLGFSDQNDFESVIEEVDERLAEAMIDNRVRYF